jgi:hypothetical protein
MALLLQSGRSLERGVQNGSRVKRGPPEAGRARSEPKASEVRKGKRRGETAPVELVDGSHGTPDVEVGANHLSSHDTHPAAHRLS